MSRRSAALIPKRLSSYLNHLLTYLDVTTANILFSLLNIDRYTESDICRLFNIPKTVPLKTESGETPGSEAPSYIVKSLDFLSSKESAISKDVRLIDFDQSFLISSLPKQMLGTPVEFLAPEVAVGLNPSPSSNIWALGCSIFRIRSGEGPFSGY
jgi:serine/threonine-protein kinase SRPK3